jgi:para-aminobenzoate synthetase component 1
VLLMPWRQLFLWEAWLERQRFQRWVIDPRSRRGLYSEEAFGYFTPDGNFDFNVVIRVFCTIKKKTMYRFLWECHYIIVTWKEYEECLLKAKAMLEVLQ